MINTEKVRLMTQITHYEKSNGVKELKMNRYQQTTYLGLQLLKVFIQVSIVFAMIAILVAGYLVLGVVSKGQTAAIGGVCLKFLILYAVSLGVSVGLTWYDGRKRYQKMKENVEEYEKKLQELEQYFDEEGED